MRPARENSSRGLDVLFRLFLREPDLVGPKPEVKPGLIVAKNGCRFISLLIQSKSEPTCKLFLT
jgi:hypothetical protein